MDAADAFVRVAAGDNEARDLCVDFIVERGEEIGRQFCATSVSHRLSGDMHRAAPHLGAPPRPSVAACLLLVVVSRHFYARQPPLTTPKVFPTHFERSSWTMRSRVDERGFCCAILSASPKASRSKSVCAQSIHRKERRA